jgi:hypothetical protein
MAHDTFTTHLMLTKPPASEPMASHYPAGLTSRSYDPSPQSENSNNLERGGEERTMISNYHWMSLVSGVKLHVPGACRRVTWTISWFKTGLANTMTFH